MRNLKYTLLLPLMLIIIAFNAATSFAYEYRVPLQSWNESFGNHRAVIQIKKPAQVVELDFKWRRHDKAIDNVRFLIINAATGDTIKNIRRIEVDSEQCKIQFGPVTSAGTYYFYYLPYHVQHNSGFARGGYLRQEEQPDSKWLEKAIKQKKNEKAIIEAVEARTAFDSFYPMELPATEKEKMEYTGKSLQDFYLFPEDRLNPIRMLDDIPYKWIDYIQGQTFQANANPNEYFTFQIGVWNPSSQVDSLSYTTTGLKSPDGFIPPQAITCFNLEGIDPYGNNFNKTVNVLPRKVQPLWFGVDIAPDQPAGTYTGMITVKDRKGYEKSVPVSLTIAGEKLEDRGDSNPYMMTRLRWLNSTLGIDDTPVFPYHDITVNSDTLNVLGRAVVICEPTGLPGQIISFGNEILASPMRFVITLSNGNRMTLTGKSKIVEQTAGHVTIGWECEDDGISVIMKATLEFDGRMEYHYTITPSDYIEIDDIRLELPVKPQIALYFMGLGLPAQDTPLTYQGNWETPETTVNHFGVSLPTSEQKQWLWPFDSYWIGNAFAGIHMELRGSDYTGPLLNVYRPEYPKSWNNDGKGGFSIQTSDEAVTVTAYSGERTLNPGEPLDYEFAFIVTPVKDIDIPGQFINRYYHNGARPMPSDEELSKGVKIVNVHHGTGVNPFINYPFLTPDSLRAFTQTLHDKDAKVKVYYTLRELSNALPEMWALRSLGHEVFRGGNGGGYNWLREHLVQDYQPQWYVHFNGLDPSGVAADAAILTAESDSRWYNYYIEGLAWMTRNLDIDGIYLDDVSFDRRILKRMRRAMDSVKEGNIIDLHSNTGFSNGPATQYAEFFPYVDKVWFGESFLYDKMTPANWLVESSGIPFGLTGDMLHRGGNPWLGMQYGMTVRYPWYTEGINCDPTEIWKIWDDFGIDKARMFGFWDEKVPVTADDSDIKVTVYTKEDGSALLSIGNYSDDVRTAKLIFDWQTLGIDPAKVSMTAPYIKDFQDEKAWQIDDTIEIEPRKGWLIYLKP